MPMPVIAGGIVAALLWMVRSRIGMILTTILIWLGVSVASHTVIVAPLIDAIKSSVLGMDNLDGFAGRAIEYVRFLGFDRALTMVFSAYAARVAVSGAKVFLAKRAA